MHGQDPAMTDDDRTMRTGRTLPHPPAAVYGAFASAPLLAAWWGPDGFTNTFDVFDFREGGRWVFTMHGPDGRSYANESVFASLEPDTRVVIRHTCAPLFSLEVRLEPAAGGTRVSWIQVFEDAATARAVQAIVGYANESVFASLEPDTRVVIRHTCAPLFTLEVRLESGDVEPYRDLMLEAYAGAADAFTSTAEERRDAPTSWWIDRIAPASGLGESFGAFVDGQLVGTVALEYAAKDKTRHAGLVIGMYVRPTVRRLGAGRRLLEAAVAAARARPGLLMLRLTVTEGNEPALRLYASIGFRAWGVEPAAIRTPGGLRGKVHMVMRLDEAIAAPGAGVASLDATLPALRLETGDDADARAVVDTGLDEHNLASAPLHEVKPLQVTARMDDGTVVGGAVGRTWGLRCELLQFWVAPTHRRHGTGSRLLARFEREAAARGCELAYLETWNFQAPDFYRARGYVEALRMDGYAPGLVRFTLHKRLTASG